MLIFSGSASESQPDGRPDMLTMGQYENTVMKDMTLTPVLAGLSGSQGRTLGCILTPRRSHRRSRLHGRSLSTLRFGRAPEFCGPCP